MPRTYITCPEMMTPMAPLCHAVGVGDLVFVSGTHPYGQDGAIASDFASQMRQSLSNLTAILACAGSAPSEIVKTSVFLRRIEDFSEMNAIYRAYFGSGPYPARTTVEARLPRAEMLIEIECVAELLR